MLAKSSDLDHRDPTCESNTKFCAAVFLIGRSNREQFLERSWNLSCRFSQAAAVSLALVIFTVTVKLLLRAEMRTAAHSLTSVKQPLIGRRNYAHGNIVSTESIKTKLKQCKCQLSTLETHTHRYLTGDVVRDNSLNTLQLKASLQGLYD